MDRKPEFGGLVVESREVLEKELVQLDVEIEERKVLRRAYASALRVLACKPSGLSSKVCSACDVVSQVHTRATNCPACGAKRTLSLKTAPKRSSRPTSRSRKK